MEQGDKLRTPLFLHVCKAQNCGSLPMREHQTAKRQQGSDQNESILGIWLFCHKSIRKMSLR